MVVVYLEIEIGHWAAVLSILVCLVLIVLMMYNFYHKTANESTNAIMKDDGKVSSDERNTPDETNDPIVESEPAYLKCLSECTSDEVIFHDYNDYDNDGICEMFALVGENTEPFVDSDDGSYDLQGKLWYINEHGAQEVDYNEITYWSQPTVFKMDDQCFLALNQAYVTGSVTYIWGEENENNSTDCKNRYK